MRFLSPTAMAACAAALFAADPTADPQFEHPVFKQHGGVVTLPEAAHQPRKNSQVVLDIAAADKSGGVIKGLDRAALIVNQYAAAGFDRKDLRVAVILHGPATQAALTDQAYVAHSSPYATDLGTTGNPNLKLLKELREAGVDLFVCGQALAHQGYATTEVAEPVQVAVSAATVVINLQMDGYAYIPFK